MSPLKWFRWKVIAVLVVLLGVFYFLGLNPLAHGRINDLGQDKRQLKWNIGQLNLGILRGLFDFDAVRVRSARSEKSARENVFSAENIHVDFDMNSALRRRLSSEVRVQMPRLTVERREDGAVTVQSDGDEKPDGSAKHETPTKDPGDWIETADRWFQTIKKWRDRLRKVGIGGEESGDSDDTEGVSTEKETAEEYSGKVTYPFDRINRLIARRIAGEGLEIAFVDGTRNGVGAKDGGVALKDGVFELLNVSEKPSIHTEQIELNMKATLAGAPVALTGTLDVRDTTASKMGLRFAATGLPLTVASYFAGDSLDFLFEDGKVDLVAELSMDDFQKIQIVPTLEFFDARITPRAGAGRIVGVDAETFCAAFNEVGTLKIDDIRVTGNFSGDEIDYEVELGDTLKEIVVSGGKNFVRKKASKELDRGVDRLKEALDKELKGVGGSELLGDDVDRIKDGLKGIFGGKKDE